MSGSKVIAKEFPNVLFIAVDDLNDWTDLLKGHPNAKTPNLDRLSRMGMRFTNAHCSAPACNPSRASILSGLLPSTSGFYENAQYWGNTPKLQEAVFLPQYFRQNGYKTYGNGKIFHKGGKPIPPDCWDEHSSIGKGPNPEMSKRPLNGLDLPSKTNFDWGPSDEVLPEEMPDWAVASYAIDKLNHPSDKPHFITAGFIKPHLPWYAPRCYFDQFPIEEITRPTVKENDLDDIPPIGKIMAWHGGDYRRVLAVDGAWEAGVQAYLACIKLVDDNLGRILDAYDRSPEKDNTIIVLWSDHGWHLGEKEHWRKFTLWEESTRVPLVIVAPGITAPGSICDAPVSLLDLYPTLVELCGLPERKNLDGHSLIQLLRNPSTKWNHVAVTLNGFKNASVRDSRWRYISYCDGTEELYDHKVDPNEWNNLAGNPEYDSVKKRLDALIPQKNILPPPEITKYLKKVGYSTTEK